MWWNKSSNRSESQEDIKFVQRLEKQRHEPSTSTEREREEAQALLEDMAATAESSSSSSSSDYDALLDAMGEC